MQVSNSKNFFNAFLLAAGTYIGFALILFGSFWTPIKLVFFWSNGLEAQYWFGPLIVGLVAGVVVASVVWLRLNRKTYAPAVFLGVSMLITVIFTVVVVDNSRNNLVVEFKPDHSIQNSLWHSLRKAPRDFQFFLHAVAIKNCIPYAWSYRQMEFYRLPANAAVNVLPPKWISECGIKRTNS